VTPLFCHASCSFLLANKCFSTLWKWIFITSPCSNSLVVISSFWNFVFSVSQVVVVVVVVVVVAHDGRGVWWGTRIRCRIIIGWLSVVGEALLGPPPTTTTVIYFVVVSWVSLRMRR
jgi:hypothetical protein